MCWDDNSTHGGSEDTQTGCGRNARAASTKRRPCFCEELPQRVFIYNSQNTGFALHQCSGRFTLASDKPQAPPPLSLWFPGVITWWGITPPISRSSFQGPPPQKPWNRPVSFFVATFLFYLCIILTSRRASKCSLLVECFGSSGYRVCVYSITAMALEN